MKHADETAHQNARENEAQRRFRAVDRLFQAVCDLPEPERETKLVELEPNDQALRAEVVALLNADASASLSPDDLRPALADALAAHDKPGEIPGFRVVGELGAGGMGIVYEAEQDRPRRTVALKVLRPGLVTPELVRRFEFEADALGRLRHPGIAQVYRAGVADSPLGPRPYFAMELVRGRRLDRWARETNASVDDRLRVFAKVCDAVQHAHANGVIHRDLKPANILVDASGTPRVLDFGVARLAPGVGQTVAEHTAAGQLVGTLPYMSPEQFAGDRADVDTRTDVYTLGVVLFELLAGRLPHEVKDRSLVEAARLVTEHPAPRLGVLDKRLRGDVETIVAKALRKEPDERYETVAALGEDVRRHLAGLPVRARPPSAVYQFTRFARRNPALVALSGAMVVVLLAATAATSAGFIAARRQARLEADARAQAEAGRAEAERQTRVANEVTAFLNMDVLAAADPGTLGKDVTVLSAIDTAAAKLDGRFEDDPVTKAAITNNIANVYYALGEYAKAEPLARAAGDTFERELGAGDEMTVFARTDLAKDLRELGRFDEAHAVFAALLPVAEASFGPGDPRTLEILVHLASVEGTGLRDFDAAGAHLGEFESRRVGVLGDDDPTTLYAALTRGNIALELKDYAGAEPAFRLVAERRALTRGPDDPATLVAQNNLAAALEGLGRYDEAEPIYHHILDVERQRSGPDHPDVLVTAHNLAFLEASMGRNDEAEALFIDTLERCRRVFGPSHFGTLTCTQSLASLYRDTGRADEAAELLGAARVRALRDLSPDAPELVELTHALGVTLAQVGRYDEAEPMLAQGAVAVRAMAPPGHPIVASYLSSWGGCLVEMGRYGEAEGPLREAYDILVAAGEAGDAADVAGLLERVRRALGDDAGADTWAARAATAPPDADG